MAYILVVEDDKQILDFIVDGFKQKGHSVERASNSLDADMYVETVGIELAIVDIMLEGSTDGIEMVKKWRKNGIKIPVIFLSARDRVEDRITGFNAGADDYLCKPYSFSELYVRVLSLLKRTGKASDSNILEYEDLKQDLLKRTVFRKDREILLQRREFMLLQYFMENAELVLGRSMILERIWGYDFDPQANVVDVLVSRLRSKIDKNFNCQLLHTVRGVGYVLKKDKVTRNI